ncbi:ferredoxin [Candidatus Collierbacteria bacterium]|nr:ferredoxin [Candidatus Collierbacteria bacterium]
MSDVVTMPDNQQEDYTKGSEKKPVKSKYQVRVKASKCIGAASCVAIAVMTFKLNENNLAEIIDQDGNVDEEKMLAAQSCPTTAIEVVDTESGEVVWPK